MLLLALHAIDRTTTHGDPTTPKFRGSNGFNEGVVIEKLSLVGWAILTQRLI